MSAAELPGTARLLRAIDVTWPAARVQDLGPWTIREGAGGGQRVSAASPAGPVSEADIAPAEAAMEALGQTPLFILREDDAELDAWLDARGYAVVDPVNLYAAPVATLASPPVPRLSAFALWPPLAIMRDIWAAGGIGPARVAVMERVPTPKAGILARNNDQPAGAAFVATDGEIAMCHAIEVVPEHRRAGVGTHMLRLAAQWAQDQGCDIMSLAVTRANRGANRLYSSLGMHVVGQYRYRKRASKADKAVTEQEMALRNAISS